MSEQSPESTPVEAESVPATTVEVEADQAVVNTAPDGGGVDNNDTPAETPESSESE